MTNLQIHFAEYSPVAWRVSFTCCRKYCGPQDLWFIKFNITDGITIYKQDYDGQYDFEGEKFSEFKKHADREDILAILPEEEKWDLARFMVALNFFTAGNSYGYQRAIKQARDKWPMSVSLPDMLAR